MAGLIALFVWGIPSLLKNGISQSSALQKSADDAKEESARAAREAAKAAQAATALAKTVDDKLGKFERKNEEHMEVQKTQVGVLKSISDNILTMKSQTEKVASIEQAIGEIKRESVAAKNASSQVSSQMMDQLSAIKAQLDSQSAMPPPLPMVPDPTAPPPDAPAQPSAPAHDQVASYTGPDTAQGLQVQGSSRTELHGNQYDAGVPSPRYPANLVRAGKVKITHRGHTEMIQYFKTDRDARLEPRTIRRVLPPLSFDSGRPPEPLTVYSDATHVSFESTEPYIVWTPDRGLWSRLLNR